MALTLCDAVLRRLDLGTAGAPAAGELQEVVGALASAHGWDPARVVAETKALEAAYVKLPSESG
jgi:glycerol-3-phosphate dehydrogenase